MIVEIISTGTELLLGQIVNSNAAFLASKLNELGFDTLYQTTVGDNRQRMSHVLSVALTRADIIITSGGLGPTQGDITKEVTAQLLGRSLYLHEPTVERIRSFFNKRCYSMPENNLRQAMIPEGAIIVDNDWGTAPGIIIEIADKTIIHLPGPPRELEQMFTYAIQPYLATRFAKQGIIVSRVLRTFGIGESALEEKIKDFIINQSNPTIALLAKHGEIHIRLTAKGATKSEAENLISCLEMQLRQIIEMYIFGVDDQTLEHIVGKLLIENNYTLALAESCTGGLVTNLLTNIPGSSTYIIGSIVCYSNQVKINTLGVPYETLEQYGAVSHETAEIMARNIRNQFNSSIAVGITGIAGPGGATPTKPVGLVYISIDGPLGCKVYEHRFAGDRKNIKHRSALAALDHLRNYILLK